MRILIIEPDAYYHPKFEEQIGSLGPLFIYTEAGLARQNIEELNPDILISELLLPDMTLYEFLEQIRTELEMPVCPVIVYSRIGNVEDVQAALGAGVNEYLIKGEHSLGELKDLLLSFNNNV